MGNYRHIALGFYLTDHGVSLHGVFVKIKFNKRIAGAVQRYQLALTEQSGSLGGREYLLTGVDLDADALPFKLGIDKSEP